jgi:hypothetical protein
MWGGGIWGDYVVVTYIKRGLYWVLIQLLACIFSVQSLDVLLGIEDASNLKQNGISFTVLKVYPKR